jgi:hypothetical protein
MLIPQTGLMTERLRVRQIDDDEGRRLVRIVRRGKGSVVTWRRAQMVLLSAALAMRDEPRRSWPKANEQAKPLASAYGTRRILFRASARMAAPSVSLRRSFT